MSQSTKGDGGSHPSADEIRTRFEHLGAKGRAMRDLALDMILSRHILPHDVLVDVGCGEGQVINWWLRQGYANRIYGLELDREVADAVRWRLRKHPNVSIITGNALDIIPPDGTFFFMFSSFQAEIVAQFADRLALLGRDRGGQVRILYCNCKYVSHFLDSGDWLVTILDDEATAPSNPVADIIFTGQPSGVEWGKEPARGP